MHIPSAHFALNAMQMAKDLQDLPSAIFHRPSAICHPPAVPGIQLIAHTNPWP